MPESNGNSNGNGATSNSNAQALNGHSGGRPSKLTRRLANQICALIANSPASIKRLSQDNDCFPAYEVLWHWRSKFPWFDQAVMQARARQSDLLVEQTVDVSQDLIGNGREMSMAEVQAKKIAIENSRWIGSKLQRRLYGDDPSQVQVQVQGQQTVPAETLADLRTRLDSARELVRDRDKAQAKTGAPSILDAELADRPTPEPQP